MLDRGMTVGEYLAKPSKTNRMGRAASLCAVMGICLWALALTLILLPMSWGDGAMRISSQVGLPSPSSTVVGLATAGVILIVACVVIRLLGALGFVSSLDGLGVVRRTVLDVMLGRPRFGISRQTLMSDIGLSVRHMPTGGIRCRNRSVPFMPNDFQGVTAEDFGGIDIICAKGDLWVFPSIEAKKTYMKSMTKRKGMMHG